MTSRVVAGVLLRLAGVWLLLRALYSAVTLFWMMRYAPAGVHATWLGGVSFSSADLYLHDTYYVIQHRPIVTIIQLIVGLLFLLVTRPIARLLTWKLDDLS